MRSDGNDPIILTSEFSDLCLEIDSRTGAPRRIWEEAFPDDALDLTCVVTIVTGGTEHRGATGGIEYRDTLDAGLSADSVIAVSQWSGLAARTFDIAVERTIPANWSAEWHYEFREQTPRLAISLEVHAERDNLVVRNSHINIAAVVSDPEAWRVHSPGNQLRTNLPLSLLAHRTAVSPAGGLRGSVGLVALDRIDRDLVCVLWPLSKTEIGDIFMQANGTGITVEWQTDVAGHLGRGGTLSCSTFHLDLHQASFKSYLAGVPAALARMGITSPGEAPRWIEEANIFEVQIGFSVFDGGFQYSPYPQAQDLLDDLGRIQDLGYNTLQIMPRQPYPSYNVHDFEDVTTSYGDADTIVELVRQCHDRGMKVIVDILLHGVLDRESIREAVAAIRTGPFAERLHEDNLDTFSLEVSEDESYLIAWSRHILDFEDFWTAGSPERHPLIDQHPEWFCRNSAGEITGIYTKAFDIAHPGWQRFFIDSALGLVKRLDIDGFRFDAPTYNYFSNWAPRTRENAAVSTMGCLALFDQLRVELKELKPDAMLYTEPSGVLHRQAMDLNYNYDEHWLIGAVMTAGSGNSEWVRNARELGEWLAERDATLPLGSVTAHHIDSHDTYWWPLPGKKWRREQFGPAATEAWMSVFALSGGPYMTFVGGESAIEDWVRTVSSVRRKCPWFARGLSDYESVRSAADSVYALVRRNSQGSGLLLVNLSDQAISADCIIALDQIDSMETRVTTPSQLGDRGQIWARREEGWTTTLILAAFQTEVLSLVAQQ